MNLVKIKANRVPQTHSIETGNPAPFIIVPSEKIDYDRAVKVECNEAYFYVYYPDKLGWFKKFIKRMWA